MRDWRTHPLMRFDSVTRWMHDLKCKDSSKAKYLEAFEVFVHAIGAESPDQLIDQYIQDMRRNELTQMVTSDQLAEVLSHFGLLEPKAKPIDVRRRAHRARGR